jgi:hypothetical protein
MGRGWVIHDAATLADHAHPLARATWIWCAPDAAASITAGSTLVFAREFSVENARMVETALLTITADQSYELSLNGRVIAAGNAIQRARRIDISGSLGTGANRFTVSVTANRATPGQSGLIASLAIAYRDGNRAAIHTDREWSCSTHEQGLQSPASELGPYNMPPWNLTDASIEQADIYPSYAQTTQLFERMGVEPDFEADAPFRFIHRNDGDEDYYFVANGEDQSHGATCRFRVTGRQPEWWDAVSGERRDLPEFSRIGGRTEIPLRLEAFESGFVVFRKPAAKASRSRGANFPPYETVATLATPWEIGFDPIWGGPERIVFSELEDWSKRPEPGIRYYSGKANYKTAFDCDQRTDHLRHFLSLGRVANIASVKINDRDLGILWCKPWRIAIPAGLLQPRGNSLEITVANLWINRLIGDSKLPENQRLTRVTSNPFHPDDPLLESGLLGPVVLQVQP